MIYTNKVINNPPHATEKRKNNQTTNKVLAQFGKYYIC